MEGNPLRIKLGLDPTGPLIHIGRGVPLLKLKRFQELGHTPVIVIGNYTAMIGDASDKPSGRKVISEADIDKNATEYLHQIAKVIDLSKAEVRYNRDWLRNLTAADFLTLARSFTFSQMITRENFQSRFRSNSPIGLNEIVYPLVQGYDSVVVKADVEIGGSDQLFNLYKGREVQEAVGQVPQDIMTLKLLNATDGRKMSTSWGNTVNMTAPPQEKYDAMMQISTSELPDYLETLTDIPLATIDMYKARLESGSIDLDFVRSQLAYSVVKSFDGIKAADDLKRN
jgi:tyrosyl-tRNA synthetase